MLTGTSVTLDQLAALRRPPGAGLQKGLALQVGAHESRLTGAGMQISEVRHYQPGDDIRHIHWRISARSNETFTKVYDVEHELPWLMLILLTPSMYFGSRQAFKSVRALDAITQLAWQRQSLHDSIGSAVLSPHGSFWSEPARHVGGLLQQLSAWADHSQPITSDQAPTVSLDAFRHFTEQLQGFIRRQQAIVLMGDFMPPYPWDALIASLHGYPTTFIQVTDPLETALPDSGRYPVLSGRRLQWLTSDRTVQQRYHDSRTRWLSELRDELDPQRHRWVRIDTTQDPSEWHWLDQEVLPNAG
ncbi:DUF58 domain-containing protein [Salinispirillum sp. LH 10-3-1]|uniref:DUF58 domain-containing protein n=1 Tax=Salinispirillum sp. LH 10-3-1 TaxID=2952525 RepID=A0AB38YJD5_9GAMM